MFFLFLFFIIFSEVLFEDEFECPRELPLHIKGGNNTECFYDVMDQNKYEISNNIIKIQWLNNQIQLGYKKTWFANIDFSSNNDLIIQAFLYDKNGIDFKRYYYGIKSNGRELFYDKENNTFINQILILSNTSTRKYESHFIRINLVNDDVHDYYLSPSFSQYGIEIIDFYNNKIIGISQKEIFDYSEYSSKFYSILKLNNEKKIYLISFIGYNEPDYYLVFQKFKFYKSDISQKIVMNEFLLIEN